MFIWANMKGFSYNQPETVVTLIFIKLVKRLRSAIMILEKTVLDPQPFSYHCRPIYWFQSGRGCCRPFTFDLNRPVFVQKGNSVLVFIVFMVTLQMVFYKNLEHIVTVQLCASKWPCLSRNNDQAGWPHQVEKHKTHLFSARAQCSVHCQRNKCVRTFADALELEETMKIQDFNINDFVVYMLSLEHHFQGCPGCTSKLLFRLAKCYWNQWATSTIRECEY